MSNRFRLSVAALGAVLTFVVLAWIARGGLSDAASLVQFGLLWALGTVPYALYILAPSRLRLAGPAWGAAIAMLGVGLPGIAIAPVVLTGDAQGGLYLLGLPIYVGLAMGAGAAGGGVLQWLRRLLIRERGPAYYRRIRNWVAPVGVLLAFVWSAVVWPSVALVVAPCEKDPPLWAQKASQRVPRAGSRIVFATRRGPPSWGEMLRQRLDAGDVGSDIYLMRADGSEQARLTKDSCNYGNPRLSPDGSRIAFEAERSDGSKLYVMRADGTDVEVLTRRDLYVPDLEWSADGSRIGYYRRDSVQVVSLDDAPGDRRLFDLPKDAICACFQLVDERHIAFVDGRDVALVDLETREKRVLLKLSAADIDDTVSSTNPRVSDFAISPDGHSVALVKEREVPISQGFAYATEIFIARSGASTISRLTPEGRSESSPSWSSDSEALVFDSYPVDIRGGPDADVYVADADGANRRRLTKDGGHSPHWLDRDSAK